MQRTSLLIVLIALVVAAPAAAEEGPPGIDWVDGLLPAFEKAKAEDKLVMICINAKRVDRGRREPAARELRQRTYRDERVIEKSKGFVCAFLTSEGSADDFGELRARYQIDGDIVSPQHIFAYPDGTLCHREEFWPHGTGEKAILAMLDLMDQALKKDDERRKNGGQATGSQGTASDIVIPDVPADAEARAKWIEEVIALVGHADEETRKAAIDALVDADQGGDLVTRLLELLEKYKKVPVLQIDIIRGLGRPGLEAAAKPLGKYLGHKDGLIRANTAVTLEYIGSKESISDLTRRAGKEKDENIANHMLRALGRCGAGESKVRKLLVKKIEGAKSEVASFGPIIGLAYFEKDEKAAKDVQKILKKWGVPSGRRSWRGSLRRTLLTWCLTEVGFGNPKSAAFLREDLIPLIPESRWSDTIRERYEMAARVCDGDADAKEDVDEMVRSAINRYNRDGDNPLMDDARRNRDITEFEPKGEWAAGRSS